MKRVRAPVRHLADQEVFGFAGLWDRSVRADGTAVESGAIITMPGNDLMRQERVRCWNGISAGCAGCVLSLIRWQYASQLTEELR